VDLTGQAPMAAPIEPAIRPIPGFEEPFSSISHLCGAGVFLILGILLLHRAGPSWSRRISLGVFAFSCVFLLSMSGVYHLLELDGTPRAVLQRLDHAAIFVLIAGTFTAAHGILFRGPWRWGMLILIWSAAITGITLKTVFFETVPEFLGLSLYLVLGWIGAFSGSILWRTFGFSFVRPLLGGGLSYTLGAVSEFLRWPVLIEGVFGPHEIFHVAVLAGIGYHWRFVRSFAAAEWRPVRASTVRDPRSAPRDR
jgi:channel protein (hemolysin III family)